MNFTERDGLNRTKILGDLASAVYLKKPRDFIVVPVPPQHGEITEEELLQILDKVDYIHRLVWGLPPEVARNYSAAAKENKVYLFLTREARKRESKNIDLGKAVIFECSRQALISQN
jgi:hypothetical protein